MCIMQVNLYPSNNQRKIQFTALKKISFPKRLENEPIKKKLFLEVFENPRVKAIFKKHDGELSFGLWRSHYHQAYFAEVVIWLDYDKNRQKVLLESYKSQAKENGINPGLRFEKEIEPVSKEFIEPLTFAQARAFVGRTENRAITTLVNQVKAMDDSDFERIENFYQRSNSNFFEILRKYFDDVYEKLKREKSLQEVNQDVDNKIKELIG